MGFVDREQRGNQIGFNDGRTTNAWGGIGGIDYTFRRIFSGRDAFAFGVLGGSMEASIKSKDGLAKTDVNGPSVGIYGVYVDGGFSIDFNTKVDFLSVDQTGQLGGFSADFKNYVTAVNLNYKLYAGTNWIEPTVGAAVTVTRWEDNFSAFDGHVVRVQAGLRFGTTAYSSWGLEPTLTALAYSDVAIDGLTAATAGLPVAPTDQGRPFFLLNPKLNFDLGKGLSTSIEGELREGPESHASAAAGRVGFRYQW